MVVLQRLLAAGADEWLWHSQYGCCPGQNTEQAVHCVRRAGDLACATRNGRLHLLAFDWKKALDSIDPQSLFRALRRFGLPHQYLEVAALV